MKLSIRTKLVLSYALVIFVTLMLIGIMTEYFVGHHFANYFEFVGEEGFRSQLGQDGKSLPPFLETVNQSILFTAIGAGIFAVLLSFVIANYITNPIKNLIKVTEQIAKGKYRKRLLVETNDEIGDLTEALNTMAQCLEDNQILQQQLISNVSHELATPLTNIAGYLEALNDGIIKKQKQKEVYALMKEEAERLKFMLDEVRSLALIQQSEFRLKRTCIDVLTTSKNVIKKMHPQLKEKSIKIKIESSKKLRKADLDKDRYTQILMNLLSNAIKYSKENGSIIVFLNENEKNFKLKVIDDGIGINKRDLPFVFERFYRTDKSRSRDTGGTGIGLTIVKELVEAHGGTIKVKSEKSKGTEFICYFPK